MQEAPIQVNAAISDGGVVMNNKDKKTDDEVEAILLALDQMGQTLGVMHQMIDRLKESVIEVDERSQQSAHTRAQEKAAAALADCQQEKRKQDRKQEKETRVSDTPIVVH